MDTFMTVLTNIATLLLPVGVALGVIGSFAGLAMSAIGYRHCSDVMRTSLIGAGRATQWPAGSAPLRSCRRPAGTFHPAGGVLSRPPAPLRAGGSTWPHLAFNAPPPPVSRRGTCRGISQPPWRASATHDHVWHYC